VKIVTWTDRNDAAAQERDDAGRAGLLLGDQLLDLETLGAWAARNGAGSEMALPVTALELLRRGPDGMGAAQAALALAEQARPNDLTTEPGLARPLADVRLRTPIPNPPSVRDFYAFEQHVRAARARRGLGMIPEWYEIPVFYFSNTAALYGADEDIAYPRRSQELDFELEVAAVIGQAGAEITAEEAPGYIAGYMVMNDWSARDLQRKEMLMNLGPAKGKDFATTFGPWLVTPDELDDRRIGTGKDERYDLAMFGAINGDQLTSANLKDLYFSFPQMIERAAQHVRLRPGDIIGSGTCGTGCILELGVERHRWLESGDLIEMGVERLGTQHSHIVADQ
jgi:fumarylacetoacetate (FAA) hydrolase